MVIKKIRLTKVIDTKVDKVTLDYRDGLKIIN